MTPRSSLPIRLLAFVILLSGAALVYGGAELILASGSLYYLSSGIALCVVAVLLFLRHSLGLQLYGVFLAASLIWSVFEAGFDGWALLARLDWWWLLALVLLLPWFSGGITRHGAPLLLWATTVMTALTGGFAFAFAAAFSDPVVAQASTAPDSRHSKADATDGVKAGDWPAAGRTRAGTSHSPLTRITAANVHQLTPAWRHDVEASSRSQHTPRFTSAAPPIKIGDTLYLCTRHSRIIALNAATGKQRWHHDPPADDHQKSNRQAHTTCRGVSYFDTATATQPPDSGGDCARRILAPIDNSRLVALDADTGHLCKQFGDHGSIDITTAARTHHPGVSMAAGPPTIAHGLVILHLVVGDRQGDQPAHVIQAYDARSGRPVWHFAVDRPGRTAPGVDTAHNLPAISVDPGLGLIYVVLGQEPPDSWASHRSPNAEEFAASVVALNIDNGGLVWRYQTVHHDLWGQNLSSQPVLTELQTHDGRRPVLIMPTRNGDLFVLDRRTGRPVLPAPETRVPQGGVQGHFVAPSQPFSKLNLRPSMLHGHDMWGLTPFDQLACRVRFKRARYEGLFTPPSTHGTIVYPGGLADSSWNGISVDHRRHILFVTSNSIASYERLVRRDRIKHGTGQNGHSKADSPFRLVIRPFISPLGLPCQQPPWGSVAAIDLSSGRGLWSQGNGTISDAVPLSPPMNMPDLGGMVTTASGVMFMTGTRDNQIRAYDAADGHILWKHQLSGSQQTSPVIYSADGREYVVVISAGRHDGDATADDTVTAYALPSTVHQQQSGAGATP